MIKSILGINAAKRSEMASTTPTIEISFDGTIFKEVVKTKLKNYTMECHLGREFVHDAIELGGSMSVTYLNHSLQSKIIDNSFELTFQM